MPVPILKTVGIAQHGLYDMGLVFLGVFYVFLWRFRGMMVSESSALTVE